MEINVQHCTVHPFIPKPVSYRGRVYLSFQPLILLTKSYVPIRIKCLFSDLFMVLLFCF